MPRKLTISKLRSLLDYDPDTGILRWKQRDAKLFARTGRGGADGAAARWNARFTGKAALNIPCKTGHLGGFIMGQQYRAQRVIWAIQTGRWPKHEIDHINGNPADNRWSNLRDVSHAENMKNRARQKNNSSGTTGVRSIGNKWEAYIKHGGKKTHLGTFEKEKDAIQARRKAEDELGFLRRGE